MSFSVHRYTKSEIVQQFSVQKSAPHFVSECEGVTSSSAILPENHIHMGEVFHFPKEARINPHFVERRASSSASQYSHSGGRRAMGSESRSRYPGSRQYSGAMQSFGGRSNTYSHTEDNDNDSQPEWASVSISDLNSHQNEKISSNDKYIYVDKTGHIEGPVTLAQLAEWVDLMILSPDTDVKPENHFEFQKLQFVLDTYEKQKQENDSTAPDTSPLAARGTQNTTDAPPPSTSPSRVLDSAPTHQYQNDSLLNESPTRILEPSSAVHLNMQRNTNTTLRHSMTPPPLISSATGVSEQPPLLPPVLNTGVGASPGITTSRTLSSNSTPSSAPPAGEAHFASGLSPGGIPPQHEQQLGMPPQHMPQHYQQQMHHHPQHMHPQFFGYPPQHYPQHFPHRMPPGPPNAPFGMFTLPHMQAQLAFQSGNMMQTSPMPHQQQQFYAHQLSMQQQQQRQQNGQLGGAESQQSAQAPPSASTSTPFNVSPFTLDQQQTFNAEDLESQFLTGSTASDQTTTATSEPNQETAQPQKKVTTPPTPPSPRGDNKSAVAKKKTVPNDSVTTERLSFGTPKSSGTTTSKSTKTRTPLIAKPPRPQPIVQHAHEIKSKPLETQTPVETPVMRVVAQSEQEDDVSLYEPPQEPTRVTIAPQSNPWAGAVQQPAPAPSALDMKQILQEQSKESKKSKQIEKKQKEAEIAQRAVGAWPSALPVQAPTALSFTQIAKQEEEARRKQKKEEQKKAMSTGSAADIVRIATRTPVATSNAWGAPSAQNTQPSLSQILQEEKKKSKKKTKKEQSQPSGGWSDSFGGAASSSQAWGGVSASQSSWSTATEAPMTVTAPNVQPKKAVEQTTNASAGFWNFDDSQSQQSSTTTNSDMPLPSASKKKAGKKSTKKAKDSSWASSVNAGQSTSKPADEEFPVLENPFGARVPKTFVQWFKNECKKMNKPELSNDSLLSFLWSVPDNEMSSYVENYFGRSNRSFASEFVAQRSFEKGHGVNMAKSKRATARK